MEKSNNDENNHKNKEKRSHRHKPELEQNKLKKIIENNDEKVATIDEKSLPNDNLGHETSKVLKKQSSLRKFLTSKKSDSHLQVKRTNRIRTASDRIDPKSGFTGHASPPPINKTPNKLNLKRSDSDISLQRSPLNFTKSPRTPRSPLNSSHKKVSIEKPKTPRTPQIKEKYIINREEEEFADGVKLHLLTDEISQIFGAQIPNKKAEDSLCFGSFKNYFSGKSEKIRYYAVFDGHGGKDCALFVAKQLRNYLEKQFKKTDLREATRVSESLVKLVKKLDRKWGDVCSDVSGCTASIVIHGPKDIYAVSVGDSKCVVVNQDFQTTTTLSCDQRISQVEEQERIKELAPTLGYQVLNGGADVEIEKGIWQLWFEQDSKSGEIKKLQVVAPPKVALKFNMRLPVSNIALSSTIGDPKFGPILNPHPIVKHYPIHDDGKGYIVVIASDGLWDVMSNKDVCNALQERKKIFEKEQSTDGEKKDFLADLQQNLPKIAWHKYGPKDYLRDDITIIVAYV